MLTPKQDIFLDKFILASSRLVVLQNLKLAYNSEMEAIRQQQITKNFRTSALLDCVRDILEELTEVVTYFAAIEESPKDISNDNFVCMQRLMSELTTYYEWACEEVKVKQMRQSLIRKETRDSLEDLI